MSGYLARLTGRMSLAGRRRGRARRPEPDDEPLGFTISARCVYSKADGGLILVRCAPPREVWEEIKFCEPDRSVVQAMCSLAELAAEAADGSILLTTARGTAAVGPDT